MELSRWVGSALAVEQSPDDAQEQVALRAYIADGPACRSTREAIERALWHLGATGASTLRTPNIRWVRPEEYLNEWRAFYRPFPVGRGFVIVPSWSDAPAGDRQVIRLDPGMAFGTGLHPTTQLAVEALEEAVCPGHDVIDVGTGSGVLAIVAALRGARRVRALDTDADAVRTARANVAQNACDDRVSVTARTAAAPRLRFRRCFGGQYRGGYAPAQSRPLPRRRAPRRPRDPGGHHGDQRRRDAGGGGRPWIACRGRLAPGWVGMP